MKKQVLYQNRNFPNSKKIKREEKMEEKNQKKIFKEEKRYYTDCFSCYDSSFANISRGEHKFSTK